ncbi:hypothetical protein RISK_001691 [Rhodopirellula islandica]|uniref:Uncharacterized protein n=1 Tax=Rhodopirellula islandica TaxID=595434 RepID=A0A0J1BIX2_RHOIS|nr:hypothetical protein RISK_001691 [Rhodopirellula islandica]
MGNCAGKVELSAGGSFSLPNLVPSSNLNQAGTREKPLNVRFDCRPRNQCLASL